MSKEVRGPVPPRSTRLPSRSSVATRRRQSGVSTGAGSRSSPPSPVQWPEPASASRSPRTCGSARPRTVFATAFAAVGLAGDYGVAWLLDRLVGPAKARELMFLNPRIRGEECLALGLINWVVPEEELEQRTSEIAARLASGPSHALDGMKQNLLRAPHEDLSTSMYAEVPLHKATGLTEDHVAAIRAFVAKEKPDFSYRLA